MDDLLKCPCCSKELCPESGHFEDGKLSFTCELCLTTTSSEELNIIIISPTMSAEVIGQAMADQIRRDGGEVPDDVDPEEVAEALKQFIQHLNSEGEI